MVFGLAAHAAAQSAPFGQLVEELRKAIRAAEAECA
jgi:hypothetical protein